MHRRMGGGPRGPNRGPSSFSQQPFHQGGGNVNPWQGGGGGNQSQNVLSQLTQNPSLALALTSLLQPQQQQQPPSLLSLNTSGGYGNRGGDYGRFGSSLMRGRDSRRHEPYNKNRSQFGNRRRSPFRKNFTKKNDQNDKKKSDKKKDDADVAMEDDENKESKRDWKDEKKEAGDGEEDKKDGESKEGKYVGVPKRYLNCNVCTKQMWDGESMGKHIRGRAHQEMIKALEESIHICVSILRENLRLAEERKLIEYNRQNRQRKYNQKREPAMSHCAMCDLKFMGNITVHRRTDGHQRLKRYLHPACRICSKEYPSRIEWIEHCLTPEHLKRAAESSEKRVGGKDGDDITEGDGEEDIGNLDADLEPLLDEALHQESNDPILEPDSPLENMVERLPAYKQDRPVATQCLKEFSGFMCELCHRSFADKEDADAHLSTKRHFFRFIELIKERFDREEKRKKAEKEAEKKKKEEAEANAKEENEEDKEGEEAEEGDGDQEMYDPSEVTEEETKVNGEEENGPEEEDADAKVEEKEEEAEPETKKEVKKEAPATPSTRGTRKSVAAAGPKSKRGKK